MHTVLVKDTYSIDEDSYLALPPEETELLRRVFEQSGGFDIWGIQELRPGHLQAEPDRLIDQMITQSAGALNAMMSATPPETLLGLAAPVETTPPDQGVFRERHQRNVELQLGLKLDTRREHPAF